VLAATVTEIEPLPVPDVPAVIVNHDALAVADHVQVGDVVSAIGVAPPPPDATD
jgi:hypothetical protein